MYKHYSPNEYQAEAHRSFSLIRLSEAQKFSGMMTTYCELQRPELHTRCTDDLVKVVGYRLHLPMLATYNWSL